jgi:hypothetical protein
VGIGFSFGKVLTVSYDKGVERVKDPNGLVVDFSIGIEDARCAGRGCQVCEGSGLR